uniref:RAB17, member RAS oncogene family n=1 Tax=Oryctolagus cuniculus TaxID=9986 RepID=A0A5F9C5Y1_RABIT
MAQAGTTAPPGEAPRPPPVFKLVLWGSGSVGKSSLALRYVKNDFRSVLPTVGCAFFTKVVDLGATSVKLEIWDTAGQEKYHSVSHLYFRGASAALLVYDISCKVGLAWGTPPQLLPAPMSLLCGDHVSWCHLPPPGSPPDSPSSSSAPPWCLPECTHTHTHTRHSQAGPGGSRPSLGAGSGRGHLRKGRGSVQERGQAPVTGGREGLRDQVYGYSGQVPPLLVVKRAS